MAHERKTFFPDGTVAVLHERGLHPSRGMGYVVRNEVRQATAEELAERAPVAETADQLGSLVTHAEIEGVIPAETAAPDLLPDTAA
jgi:hypothetical protein